MKNETIWMSLTDIREEYIEEASPDCENTSEKPKNAQKLRQKKLIGWGALAAVLAVAIIAASPLIARLFSSDTIGEMGDDAYADYPTRPMADFVQLSPSTVRIYTFEYTIDGKAEQVEFPIIEWGDETYALSRTERTYVTVDTDQMGDLLGEVETTAYAIKKPVSVTLGATLYVCEGIDPSYGMVVKLEGQEEAFLYRSGKYAESLDELIEKANYRELMTVSPHIFHTTQNGKGETVQLVFEGMTADILWNELLSQGETVDYDGADSAFLRVSIGHELLQYESVLCISADGYITFGALKAGKAVYVGKDCARAFLDYLEDNLTGYRLVEEAEQSPSPEETPEQTVVWTTAAKPYDSAAPE